jgi:hypothetical protein
VAVKMSESPTTTSPKPSPFASSIEPHTVASADETCGETSSQVALVADPTAPPFVP